MLKELKPLLIILGRFLGIWLGLFIIYQSYLNLHAEEVVDPYTRSVAVQTEFLLNMISYPTTTADLPASKSILLLVNQIPATRIVEGCNAISVMILFSAFVFAFYSGRKTWLFVGGGVILLFILNLMRIVILNVVVVDWPQYTKAAHDYFFPAVIYGGVVLLWLIWIQFFAVKKPLDV